MTSEPVRAGADWLALREPADAVARSRELVEELRALLPPAGALEIHDLGCGTGSMARWLAPQLDGPQHWVLHDRDADLLVRAQADPPRRAADGAAVTAETRRSDISRLTAADLAGAALVTASALLDMMTADELERVVDSCTALGCPVLVTLSVVGHVELSPADPSDRSVREAFNAHQRRTVDGATLLGPDAAVAAVDAFARRGRDVVVRPSPWRLGPGDSTLAAEWFTGWLGAAVEQRPGLAGVADRVGQRRAAEAAAGRLSVTVHHQDLLVRPTGSR